MGDTPKWYREAVLPFYRLATRVSALSIAVAMASACGSDPSPAAADAAPDAREPGPAQALFVLPGVDVEQGFFALPYPNNLRLGADGFINLDDLVRPNAVLADFINTIDERQTGFGLTSGVYMRFDGALDPASLPSEPIRSQIPEASVYLVNLEESSPNYGRKVPLDVGFHKAGGELIGENWLACMPFPGTVLEEASDYALVATTRLLAEDGTSVSAAPVFEEIMGRGAGGDSNIAEAKSSYAPLTAWLDEDGGDEREDVVSASVFTTQAPTKIMGQFRRVIHDSVPAPVARDIAWRTDRPGYAIYTGRFDSPNFQAGQHPFKSLENGGGFVFDAGGDPVVQSTNDLRFSMTIPTDQDMPEEGWPLVLYGHGTTGDYLSYEQDGTAERMASRGLAVMSMDQVMHGDRLDEGDVQTLFFNFLNPLSSQGNVMQAALENYQLVRLAQGFELIERHVGGRTVRFDSSNLLYFGHSQGSVTGVPFTSYEPHIKGAVFSGAGGLLLLTLITKTEPFDIKELLRLIIRDPEITQFHPALSLLQAFYEPADGIVHARLLVQEPPEGLAPKSIFHPMGLGDTYTPVPGQNALATAFGLDLVSPVLEPIAGLEFLEKRVLNPPVTNNAGEVTAIGAQYEPPQGSDGHFVSFNVAAAKTQSAEFLRTLVETGNATVVAP
ncbi:MAG: hypothetical protein GY811_02735 [Myxococcales bacterium]|nr:hypothetical protein [Myxococcales bacterium]